MAVSPTIPSWKSVTPNRKDNLSLERSIKVLDRQLENTVGDIITNITNIIDGTEPLTFVWAQYTGP